MPGGCWAARNIALVMNERGMMGLMGGVMVMEVVLVVVMAVWMAGFR